MTGRVFVDSNVLVYRRDSAVPVKQERAAAWISALWKCGEGRVSLQVLHEFYVTVTRKLSPGLPAAEAREDARDFIAWQPQPLTGELLELAWEIETRHKLHFWDSAIVGAASLQGCRYLLTEDLQAGRRLDDIEVVDPFETSPEILGFA